MSMTHNEPCKALIGGLFVRPRGVNQPLIVHLALQNYQYHVQNGYSEVIVDYLIFFNFLEVSNVYVNV